MRKLFAAVIICFLTSIQAQSQGCVAIRGAGGSCSKMSAETAKGWRLGTSYRYFKSLRHFVGTDEQEQRLDQHTEVINWQHTINFELTRHFNNRWSLGLYIPVLSNTRSSL